MSRTTGKWVVEWRINGQPFNWRTSTVYDADKYRLTRPVERTFLGFVWRGTEVYRGQVDAGNSERICRALNGETQQRAVCNVDCTPLVPGTTFAATGTLVYDPCPTCLARAREEGKAEERGKWVCATSAKSTAPTKLKWPWATLKGRFGDAVTVGNGPTKPIDRRTGADRRKAAKRGRKK